MAITLDDLKSECFTPEMLGQDAADFDEFLQAAIDRISARLAARIGAALYGSSEEPTAADVKEAELHLCVEELWRKRITWKLGNAQGDQISCKYETEARDKAHDLAGEIICRLVGGDFASGLVESSHFNEATV